MRTLPIPRLPFVRDPLRRVHVPTDLDEITSISKREDEAAAGGMTADGVDRIWGAAEDLFRTGFNPAIALCVRRQGKVVLDRSIGWARGGGPGDDPRTGSATLATPDTPHVIFSASKAITATVTHLLDERGLLHVDDRVAEYIPEFGKHGKDAITIEHILCHRAGIPTLPGEVLDLENATDRDFLVTSLCEQKPRTRPGRLLAYHAVSGGFLLGEIVERVTGKDIRTVLAEEILEPLGFRWCNYGVAEADVGLVAEAVPTGPPVLPPLSNVLERALGKVPDEVTRLSNDPRFLTAIIPAGNVVATANELSRFFELLRNDGELDGVKILEGKTIRRATVERAYREFDLTLGAPMRLSNGYLLGAQTLSLFGPDTEHAFGHLGFTNILGWADPQRDLAVGLITSGKPVLHHGLYNLWELTRQIGLAAPKVAHAPSTAPR